MQITHLQTLRYPFTIILNTAIANLPYITLKTAATATFVIFHSLSLQKARLACYGTVIPDANGARENVLQVRVFILGHDLIDKIKTYQ